MEKRDFRPGFSVFFYSPTEETRRIMTILTSKRELDELYDRTDFSCPRTSGFFSMADGSLAVLISSDRKRHATFANAMWSKTPRTTVFIVSAAYYYNFYHVIIPCAR